RSTSDHGARHVKRPPRLIAALLCAPLAAWSLGAAAQQAPLAPSAADVPSSPLAEAASRGDFGTVRKLLGHVDVNALDRDGTPALHWAVRAGNRDTVEQLLAAGAKVDAQTRLGVRPLEIAIEKADAPLVRVLLAAGADPTQLDRAGEPPLLIA